MRIKLLAPLVFVLHLFFLALFANAQITTNSSSGLAPTYPNLVAAITALNSATITSPVVIAVTAGNPQTAPVGGYNITATGTSSNTITFTGNGNIVTAFSPQASGSLYDAVIKIVGGSYITIQGFTLRENPTNTRIDVVTNGMTEFGILMLNSTPTTGCQNNTLQNNTITLNALYRNSVGIFSTSGASPLHPLDDATSTAGTNSNNKVYGNTISNTAYGIYFISPPVTVDIFETGNDIGGTSAATGNTITFGNDSAMGDAWRYSSTVIHAGIEITNSAGNSIRYNTITSTSKPYTYTGFGGLQGISLNISSIEPVPEVNYTSKCSNNIITLPSTGTVAVSGIDFGFGTSSGTIEANNNNITLTQTLSIDNAADPTGIKANYFSYSNTCNGNTVVINTTQTTGISSANATGVTLAASAIDHMTANSNNITINQTTSGTGKVTNGQVICLNVEGSTVTNTVLNNSIVVNQTTSVANGFTAPITGIAAGQPSFMDLIIGAAGNPNNITIKQAVTGSGSYGNGAVTYIYINNHNNVSIVNNNFNTTGSVIRSSGALNCILSGNSTIDGLLTIKSNTTAIDRVAATGTVGFFTQNSTNPFDPIDSISNNNISFSSLATSGAVTVINRIGGADKGERNICNNIISVSGTNSGTVTCMSIGYGSILRVYNNSLTVSCRASTVQGIVTNQTSFHPDIQYNTISLTSNATTATTMVGINTAPLGNNIANNIISNLSFTGVSTSNSTVRGIVSSKGTGNNIHHNTISGISAGAAGSSGSPVLDGILISGGITANIYNNKITGITTASTGNNTLINGIRVISGTPGTPGSSTNIYNNLIGNLTPTAVSSTDAVRGISITSTETGTLHTVSNNTVYLTASTTGTNFGTTGVYHTANTDEFTSGLVLQNNLIVNNSTPKGTGRVVAFRRSSGSAGMLANFIIASNTNSLYAGTPGTSRLIYSDGTSTAQTISAYIGGVFTAGTISPRDANSVTENPTFRSTTSSNGNYLKIDTLVSTQLESGGTVVSSPSISADYFNIARYPNSGYPDNPLTPASAPDIGANEFGGFISDGSGPIISYTPVTAYPAGENVTLTATITDPSGVPTSGAGLPVLYHKINSGVYSGVTANSIGSNQFTFTFGAASAASDIVSYYIVAQDNLPTPNLTCSPGGGASGFTSSPPSVSIPPTTPSAYTAVGGPMSGDYTVGTTLFRSVTGLNIQFEERTRMVEKEITETEEKDLQQENTEVNKTESDKSKSRKELKGFPKMLESDLRIKSGVQKITGKILVEEKFAVPMLGGKEYTGSLKHILTKEEKQKNNLSDNLLGVYATITAALADVNGRGISANTNLLLTDALYSSGTETFPLVVNVVASSVPGPSAILTIKPNTGVTSAIAGSVSSGATIKIFKTNYVVIDGSNGGTNSKDLTISNSATTSPYVFWLGSNGTTPITNTVIKNCVINNGSRTPSTAGIVVSSGTVISNAGYSNNIIIQNNTITKAAYGININSVISAGNGGGLVVCENDLTASGADGLRNIGVYVQGVSGGAIVSNNAIANFNTTTGEIDKGIWFATGTTEGTISGNTISNLSYTGTGSFSPYGIYLSTGGSGTGITVSNNNINSFTSSGTTPAAFGGGILINGTSNVNVTGNTVSNILCTAEGTPMGILTGGASTDLNISKNTISNIKNTSPSQYGACGILLTNSSDASATTLTNNVVYDVTGLGYASGGQYFDNGYGIYIGVGGGYKLYYNTVYMNTNQSQDGLPAAVNIFSSITAPGSIDMRNNIFYNAQTVGAQRYSIICVANASVFSHIDYNNYYSAGPNIGFLFTDCFDINSLRAALGQDTSSISAVVPFVSETNLAIDSTASNAWNVHGWGMPISSVNSDFTQRPRSTCIANGPTDIGAYNVTPLSMPPEAIATGTPSPGITNTYSLNGRTIGAISWGPSLDNSSGKRVNNISDKSDKSGKGSSFRMTIPSSASMQKFSGAIVPDADTSYTALKGMGFWRITTDGTNPADPVTVTFNFGDEEMGTVDNPDANMILAKYDSTTRVWVPFYRGVLDGQSIYDPVAKTISVNGLTEIHNSIFALTSQTTPLKRLKLNLTALIQGYYDEIGNTSNADVITIQLKNNVTPFTNIDGNDLSFNTSGQTSLLSESSSTNTPYYIAVKHRNGIDTWSASAQSFSLTTGRLTYDFTTSSSQAFGDNMILKGTKWCIYNGDINQDQTIDLNDAIPVLTDYDNLDFHLLNDVNGDGTIDLNDVTTILQNYDNLVGIVIPARPFHPPGKNKAFNKLK